jgi:hypothetical protein
MGRSKMEAMKIKQKNGLGVGRYSGIGYKERGE